MVAEAHPLFFSQMAPSLRSPAAAAMAVLLASRVAPVPTAMEAPATKAAAETITVEAVDHRWGLAARRARVPMARTAATPLGATPPSLVRLDGAQAVVAVVPAEAAVVFLAEAAVAAAVQVGLTTVPILAVAAEVPT